MLFVDLLGGLESAVTPAVVLSFNPLSGDGVVPLVVVPVCCALAFWLRMVRLSGAIAGLAVSLAIAYGAGWSGLAMLAGLTAVLIGRIAWRLVRPVAGPWVATLAAVVFLGTPWVIVTGSLAYNEMVVTLLLATGLLIVGDKRFETPAAVAPHAHRTRFEFTNQTGPIIYF